MTVLAHWQGRVVLKKTFKKKQLTIAWSHSELLPEGLVLMKSTFEFKYLTLKIQIYPKRNFPYIPMTWGWIGTRNIL